MKGKSSDVNASMYDVAGQVCAHSGHDIVHIERSDLNVDKSYSQFICRKCGMSIEEIREVR